MRPTNRFLLTRRQLVSVLSHMSRSRIGQASTGLVLANILTLLQTLAIVGGGGWVLLDYFEFTNRNHELTNAQATLAIQTAQLAQSGAEITNMLNQLKLQHTSQKRLDSDSESSAVRAAKFDDGTALYRFQFSITVKNISETNILIPALVVEFFLGTTNTVKNLRPGTASLINQPSSWSALPVPGAIDWSRLSVSAMRLDSI